MEPASQTVAWPVDAFQSMVFVVRSGPSGGESLRRCRTKRVVSEMAVMARPVIKRRMTAGESEYASASAVAGASAIPEPR